MREFESYYIAKLREFATAKFINFEKVDGDTHFTITADSGVITYFENVEKGDSMHECNGGMRFKVGFEYTDTEAFKEKYPIIYEGRRRYEN